MEKKTVKGAVCAKTLKAYGAFERSLSRVLTLSADPEALTHDEEEHWEAYCSRFG